jgi:hypothetical protein
MARPKPGRAAVAEKVRRDHLAPAAASHLTGMEARLARVEKAIAEALNTGDLARVRRLSKQWSRLHLSLRSPTGSIFSTNHANTVDSQLNRMWLLGKVKRHA